MQTLSLEDKRKKLTNSIPGLVIRAKQEKWCVYEDHCLLRLIYDYIFLDDWRKHVKSPAYKHLNNTQLNRALSLIDKMQTCDKHYISLLQFASLRFRGKIN